MRTLRVLIHTTIAMFGVPMLVMLLTYHVVIDQFLAWRSPPEKMVYAGIAGVFAVQFVIIGFLLYAFSEPDDESASTENKKEKSS